MRFVKQLSAAALLPAVAAPAWAHGGHGLQGTHWHATDVAGLVFVAVLAGVAILLSRGE